MADEIDVFETPAPGMPPLKKKVKTLEDRIERIKFRLKRAEEGNDPSLDVEAFKEELAWRESELDFRAKKLAVMQKDK